MLPRLRELQARRDELAATLAKVVPLTAPPSHLYAETTIARFQQTIRDLFLGADQTLAKNYLRFLIDRVDISGNELTIHGKAGAAIALLAAGPDAPQSATVNPAEVVLTSAGGWLPKRSISRTWKYAQKPQPRAAAEETPPPQESARGRQTNRAALFASLMAQERLTRSGLAAKLGVSRAWVTKVLRNTGGAG
jgi:hypothetical protein